MCDKLAGRYPKDFKFTGWHPHCRCYATSILKTDDEIAEDTRKMLAGEAVDGESVNRVDDVPEGFKAWVKENEERAKTHYSVPHFLNDNMGYVPKDLLEAYGSLMPYNTYAEYEAKGRYEIYCQWKKTDTAHVFIVERTKKGDLIWFDPQSGRRGITFDDYVEDMLTGCVKIRRIDNQLINPKFAQRLIKARKQL